MCLDQVFYNILHETLNPVKVFVMEETYYTTSFLSYA